MRALPFRKYQDFYLRLGFLKLLVHVLPPDRRSTSNDAVDRRLREVLFRASGEANATVLQRCLATEGVASTLHAITPPTVYKILEWGHDIELVTRGNQLTERGLMLRRFSADDTIGSFLAGDGGAWNPFVLDENERACLLYHLLEVDEVTLELAERLAQLPRGLVIEHRAASELTCRSIFAVLERARPNVAPALLPQLRTAFDLATTIAQELGIKDLLADRPQRPRLPKPLKALPRTGSLTRSKAPARARQTTKSADHQTVPRFEQLADLGFVSKRWNVDGSSVDDRHRWRYVVDPCCIRFVDARRKCVDQGTHYWERSCFGASIAALKDASAVHAITTADVIREIWSAYQATYRSIGHTPLDSMALYATIVAAEKGICLEQERVHDIMLRIKQKSLLPAHAFFASGNDFDKMFVLLKPGFVEAAESIASQLEETA